MTAVDNIVASRSCKQNIWDVNTEMEYHEEKNQAESTNGKAATAREQNALATQS